MAVGYLFSGQGAQAVGMGESLYRHSAAAKALFDEADDVLGFGLKALCFEGPQTELTQTRVCQPALYVHGLAMVAALRDTGALPEPACALGLSLGELTALAMAGVYDFATGLRVVAERGRLMQQACEATEGTMASLIGGTPEAAFELAAKHDVDVGNLNNPGQIVLSGAVAGIEGAAAEAKAAGFKMAVKLDVAGAYHSRLMQPAADAFADFLADIPFAAPAIAVFSNATGTQVSDPADIKARLVDQVTRTVRWEDCFRGALKLGVSDFYECGPGGVLAGIAKRIDRGVNVTSLSEWSDLNPAN